VAGIEPDTSAVLAGRFYKRVAGVALLYFLVLAAPSVLLKNPDLSALWFRTALPVSYIGGAALHWILWRARRPTLTAISSALARDAGRHPGWTIWNVGSGAAVMVWALTVPLAWPAATEHLRGFEIAIAAVAVGAIVGGFVLRRVLRSSVEQGR
jgi:hypothetical protein